MLDDGAIISFGIARYDRRNQESMHIISGYYFCIVIEILFCYGDLQLIVTYPPTFIILIDTYYIHCKKELQNSL